MRGFLAFVLLTTAALPALAQKRKWQEATVVSVESSQVATAAWGDINILHYKIETSEMLYELEYAFNPAVKAPWPGQHSRNRAPEVTVNGKVKIAIEGHNAHLLDDSGHDVKLPIVSKTAKNTK